MDPLSALGIAASVVQFVQFAMAIFNGSRKIHASASGAPEDSESLENIHETLSAFSSSLRSQIATVDFANQGADHKLEVSSRPPENTSNRSET